MSNDKETKVDDLEANPVLIGHFNAAVKTHPDIEPVTLFHAGAAAALTMVFKGAEAAGERGAMQVIDHLLSECITAFGLEEELEAEGATND